MANKPTVLFDCVHNAGRSQMADGVLLAPRIGAISFIFVHLLFTTIEKLRNTL